MNNASVTGLRKSLTFEQNSNATVNSGGTAKLLPAYDDSLERIFSAGQIFNIGIDNDFQNAATTNNNNIERVDHILAAAAHAADATTAGFVVFDRGASGTHDPFNIAAIKTLDANGDPASYYNAVNVAAGNYGSNVGGAFNFLTLRKNDGDPGLLLMNNSTAQNRDGVFFRFSDLGVANNAPIYGYSLFAPDVVVSPATNLVDYSNATNFPTTSDFSNGGLHQIAVSGVASPGKELLSDKASRLRWQHNRIQPGCGGVYRSCRNANRSPHLSKPNHSKAPVCGRRRLAK